MTKLSSGAECKVQVRLRLRLRVHVHVRVEVAPALSGRERVEEEHCGCKGQVSPKTPAPRSPPFSCGQAPFGSFSLAFRMELQKLRMPAV